MRSACLLILAAACAPAPAAPPPRAPAPAVPPVVATPEPVAAAPERALGPNRCLPAGPPKAREARKVYRADTCADHRKAEAVIAKKLQKAYDKAVKASTLDVSFDCDPLTGELEELVIETGYGHGGNLELWRIRPAEGGAGYDVLALGHAGYYRAGGASEVVLVGRGRFAKAAFDKALGLARPALTAIVRELEPPPPPNGMWGRSFSTSSGNFHHYFRLSDGSHELVRHFTGYPGSSDQPRYVGLTFAMDAIRPLLETVKLEPGKPSEAERDFFVASFLAASPRFDDDFAWWVRDRYVRLALELGTAELVPALVDVLASGLSAGEEEKSEERKKEVLARRLADPIAALVRITGWDPRRDAGGAERAPAAVAREMLDECRRALTITTDTAS